MSKRCYLLLSVVAKGDRHGIFFARRERAEEEDEGKKGLEGL